MPALGADQRGDPALRRRPRSHVADGRREGQLGRRTARSCACTASTCSSVAVTAASPCSVAGTNTDQNCAPTPPARSRGQVGVGGAAAADDVEPVPVVAGLLAGRPRRGRCGRRPRGARRGGRGSGREVSEGMREDPTRRARPDRGELEWQHGVLLEPRQRRAGHPRVHPQRGRLRGARGPPRRRGLDPRRRRRRRRRRGGEHLRVRRAGQEGLHRHPARGGRPQGDRAHPGGGRRRLPGRALRPDPRRRAARRRRRARLRLLPRHVQPPHRHPRCAAATPPTSPRAAPTGACCCRCRRSTARVPPGRRRACPGHATTASSSCARGSTRARGRR